MHTTKNIAALFKSHPVSLAVIPAIVIALSFGLNYAYATWAEPIGTPPNNNTDTPLNVGATAQTKTGTLAVGSLSIPASGLIIGNGASGSSYGALTIQGSSGGYSGLNFRDSAGNAMGEVMTNGSYAGFYNPVSFRWRLFVSDAGSNPSGYGNVVANDYYIASVGKWASQLGGGGGKILQSQIKSIFCPSKTVANAMGTFYNFIDSNCNLYQQVFNYPYFECNISSGSCTGRGGDFTLSTTGLRSSFALFLWQS